MQNGYKPERFQLPSMRQADCKENMRRRSANRGHDPGTDEEILPVGERRDDLALGDGDQGLAVQRGDDLEQQPTPGRIELARYVVEEQDRWVAQAGLDVGQLGQL